MKFTNDPLFSFSALADSIRFGFATNSSSAHSILLTDAQTVARLREARSRGSVRRVEEVPDEDGEEPFQVTRFSGWDGAPEDMGYGWGWFVLTEREEKLDYLWTNLRAQVLELTPGRPDLGPVCGRAGEDFDAARAQFADACASAILEHTPAASVGVRQIAYIDHDSTFSFPLRPERWGGAMGPDASFARWFRDRVLRENVIVVGGNNNQEHDEYVPGVDVRLADDEFRAPFTVYDRGDHWLLFRRSDGAKLRLPKEEGAKIEASPIPELVDVKVTDQCGMGCTFCYQDSTPTGKHPTMSTYDMARLIKDLGVLEVAVGGGEPLEWPDFWQFVNALHDRVVVNVTTRRLDQITSVAQLAKLGAVGFSCETSTKLRRAFTLAGFGEREEPEIAALWRQKLTVHIVLGATPMRVVVELLELCDEYNIPALLLGYKTDGRGGSHAPHPYDDWIERLVEAFGDAASWRGPQIGVDTPIVQRWGEQIEKRLQVDPRLMTAREGAFSLYIDFVTETMAPASYGEEAAARRVSFADAGRHGKPGFEWRDIKAVGAEILQTYQTWNGTLGRPMGDLPEE